MLISLPSNVDVQIFNKCVMGKIKAQSSFICCCYRCNLRELGKEKLVFCRYSLSNLVKIGSVDSVGRNCSKSINLQLSKLMHVTKSRPISQTVTWVTIIRPIKMQNYQYVPLYNSSCATYPNWSLCVRETERERERVREWERERGVMFGWPNRPTDAWLWNLIY